MEEHPFDERLRGQLMLCLYRAGRQLDALALYQETRRILVDELGVEPGPQLRELERAILRQDPELAAPAVALEPLKPSRRTVTVFFADLGPTVAEPIDPERLGGALDRSSAPARVVVERYGGTLEKLRGATLMAVFGAPKAHEDDPLRAVRSAIAVRDALLATGGDLEARIGVSTGEVYVESSEADVAGAPVNLAKRLQEAARPGEILVSAATLRLVRHAVTTEAARPLGRGREKPMPCFRLLEVAEHAPTPPRQLDAPLIGRDRELAALRAAYERSCDQRRSQLVTVSGEPGIGKTRLVLELLTWLRDQSTALIASCDAYSEGASYLPLADMLRQAGEDFATVTADTASTDELALSVRHRFEELARDRPLLLVSRMSIGRRCRCSTWSNISASTRPGRS
jgi:class 3 adenylate cyclase